MTTVVIFGAGLIGMFVGLNLATNPENKIYLVGRRSEWKSKVQSKTLGFSNISKSRKAVDQKNIRFVLSLSEVEEDVDYLIVTLKRIGLDEAAGTFMHFNRKIGSICTLMNGINATRQIAKVLGESIDYIEGIWTTNVVELEDEHSITWHSSTFGYCYLDDNGSRLASEFNKTRLETKVHPNLINVQYGKLLMNLNNAVNALSGLNLKAQLNTYQYRRLTALCILEALKVYKQTKIQPVALTLLPFSVLPILMLYCPDFLFRVVSDFVLKIDASAQSSMFMDIQAKRKTEIDYLQGEIIRLASTVGCPTPVCQSVFSKIKEKEESREGIVPLSAADIYPS